jgi:hypothetical protein
MNLKLSRQNVIYILILVFLIIVSITPHTLARLLKTSVAEDSAVTAKFDVNITMPNELNSELGNEYEYYFSLGEENKSFEFKINNNSEVAVICTLYMEGDIQYKILIADEAQNEIFLSAGESANFQLVVSSGGLSTDITEVSFFTDIRQAEGEETV